MKPVLDYKESFETVIPVFMVCSYSFSVYIYEVSIFMLIPYFFYQEVEDLPISDVQYESWELIHETQEPIKEETHKVSINDTQVAKI